MHQLRAFAAVVTLIATLAIWVRGAELGVTSQSQSPLELADAMRLFYTGRYEDAAAMALELRAEDDADLASYELRSSALLFQIRRAIGEPKDKEKALKQCAPCASLMSEFRTEIDKGRERARERLKSDPKDVTARFLSPPPRIHSVPHGILVSTM